jgi:flagellar biosynthesis/type III secretory pathway M-ring protein FliF/YscJ
MEGCRVKKLIAICVTVIVCAAIFAVPLYYRTFSATSEHRYVTLDQSPDNREMGAIVLSQETGFVYNITTDGATVICQLG